MAPVIIVTKGKEQIARVSVNQTTYTIGRSKHSNLILNEELASRHHAEITHEKGAYWLDDCKSRNGTKVNGEDVTTKRRLLNGDEITIGATKLMFVWDEGDSMGVDGEDGATMAAGVSDADRKYPGQEVVTKKDKGLLRVKLTVADAPDGEPAKGAAFCDWEGTLAVGRDHDNHVVFLTDSVSHHHARIEQENNQYFVQDLGSSNGTFLNGVKIHRERLSNRDKINIGGKVALVFELVDLQKQRRTIKYALIGASVFVVIALAIKLLQPPDLAAPHIAKAQEFFAEGQLSVAMEECKAALTIDGKRPAATELRRQIKAAMEVRQLLADAEEEARRENYDKALDLVYRVTRDFPNNERGRELEAVIKAIENAQIAYAARNWADAIRLLEKAREAYPNSSLITNRLSAAGKESFAEKNFAKAKDALNHQQADMAKGLLRVISSNSVYYTAAKELLDKINRQEEVALWLGKAKTTYRRGQIPEALVDIENGLQTAPNDTSLLSLREQVREMEKLVVPLGSAEALCETNTTDALVAGRKICEEIIRLEQDPLNKLRERAQATQTQLARCLQMVAQGYVSKAEAALQAKDRKAAIQFYLQAVKANPANQQAVEAADKLRAQITAECRSLYQKGIVLDDLQQRDLAREAFSKVLEIGFPGEEYYERAAKKLKSNAP